MVEPTDDDERTNSIGLFNTAEAYRLSAMELSQIKHGHAEIHGGFSTTMRLSFI